jgi:3alpha(or 20beta)-hydroxysteroid dehydrogenase
MRLAGKVAIISGAASGMGAATARRFGKEGASVVVADMLETEGRASYVTGTELLVDGGYLAM